MELFDAEIPVGGTVMRRMMRLMSQKNCEAGQLLIPKPPKSQLCKRLKESTASSFRVMVAGVWQRRARSYLAFVQRQQ